MVDRINQDQFGYFSSQIDKLRFERKVISFIQFIYFK